MAFGEWHEAYLQIIGNQIALGIDRMAERTTADAEADAVARPIARRSPRRGRRRRTRTLTYYKKDEAIFVDGEYLIRNIPARILWKLLGESRRSGRTEFTNREVRLDESLGLPAGERQLRKPSHTPAASAAGEVSRPADRLHRPRTLRPPDRRVDRNDRAVTPACPLALSFARTSACQSCRGGHAVLFCKNPADLLAKSRHVGCTKRVYGGLP